MYPQNFPEEVLLHCQGKDAVETHFKSRIKEVQSRGVGGGGGGDVKRERWEERAQGFQA